MRKLFLSILLLFPLGALPKVLQPNVTEPSVRSYVPKTYSFNIVLEPLHLTIFNSEITSNVLKINKTMGESFTKGEALVEMDDKVFEGNYSKALSSVTKFKTELEAKKRLYEDDALSQFELDDGIASLQGAEADLIVAKKLHEGTKILAPYDGKVVKVAIKQFELAQPGKELIAIVNDEILFAKFLAPSSLVQCLRTGMNVDVYVKETGDKISTTIARIAPVIDPSSSTIMVEAQIDNHDNKLWAGMTGKVTISECSRAAAADIVP